MYTTDHAQSTNGKQEPGKPPEPAQRTVDLFIEGFNKYNTEMERLKVPLPKKRRAKR